MLDINGCNCMLSIYYRLKSILTRFIDGGLEDKCLVSSDIHTIVGRLDLLFNALYRERKRI